MKITFNDFRKQYNEHKTGIDRAFERVLTSGQYILGEEGKAFERGFLEYTGAKHSIGVANGLEALQISLMANGIKQDDEVITTPCSAVATALAITAIGAKPIFVDIDDYFHIDADKIAEAITEKTRAIIPVHLYGQAADMEKIIKIAKRHKLVVIEDCAQAHGAKLNGKMVGTFGIAGCFSFYPTKNLGAFGDAGAIVTNDEAFATKCRMIRNYGQKNRYEHVVAGINSRLDEIQAAVLRLKLKRLDQNNSKRRKIAEIYINKLSGVKKLKIIGERKGARSVWHLFVIEVANREELIENLKSEGIDTLIHYPIPLHKQKCFPKYNKLSLPMVEEKVKKILSLPINPTLTKAQILHVCKCILKYI